MSYFAMTSDARELAESAVRADRSSLSSTGAARVLAALSLVRDGDEVPDEIPEDLDPETVADSDVERLAPQLAALAVDYYGLDEYLAGVCGVESAGVRCDLRDGHEGDHHAVERGSDGRLLFAYHWPQNGRLPGVLRQMKGEM